MLRVENRNGRKYAECICRKEDNLVSVRTFRNGLNNVFDAVEPKLPFRGPEFFRDGDRTYICKVCGGFEWFTGSEAIFHGENKVYECVFHGGFVR